MTVITYTYLQHSRVDESIHKFQQWFDDRYGHHISNTNAFSNNFAGIYGNAANMDYVLNSLRQDWPIPSTLTVEVVSVSVHTGGKLWFVKGRKELDVSIDGINKATRYEYYLIPCFDDEFHALEFKLATS
jgi:hypothetical protein